MGTELYVGQDHNDVNARLDRTICRYNNEPVYVRYIGGSQINLYELDKAYPVDADHEAIRARHRDGKLIGAIEHTDPKFDWRSPPLGYMNRGGVSYYCRRTAYRQYIQGLRQEMLITSSPNDERKYLDGNYSRSKDFYNCIMGVYPGFQETMELLKNPNVLSCAFARRLSLVKNGTQLFLHHRERAIGVWYKNAGRFEIFPAKDYSFLVKFIKKNGGIV